MGFTLLCSCIPYIEIKNLNAMKAVYLISIIMIWCVSNGFSQDGTEFDFWVGNWNLTWEYSDGTEGKGINHIVKTLDDKVIQENFEATDGGPYSGFKGTSISVFNPNSKMWRQAWADNQGGYFNFIGEVGEGLRIFKTNPVKNQQGQDIILRMRFYEIQPDSFTWDWEQSKDGGESWALQWRIHYERQE